MADPMPPWFGPLMDAFGRISFIRDGKPTAVEKDKAARFFHYGDWDDAQENGGSHGPRVTADLARLLHNHACPLRTALKEAHEVLHECTAVLSAADCARVAATMAVIRRVLSDSDGSPQGGNAAGGAVHDSAGAKPIAQGDPA